MAKTITSRQFDQDTSRAKKLAARGPVYITDRGGSAHVLLTVEDYERLIGERRVIDLLGDPPEVADIELTQRRARELAHPASID